MLFQKSMFHPRQFCGLIDARGNCWHHSSALCFFTLLFHRLRARSFWGKSNSMSTITLKAHFDGKQICLDEPYELQPDSKLIVAVVSGNPLEDDRQAWLAASQAGFARAYGDDEPDYSNYIGKMPPSEKMWTKRSLNLL